MMKSWSKLKAPLSLLKSWCHRSYGNARSSARSSSRSHLLFYGGVAFAWERERISNEDVMSCLKGYLEGVSGQSHYQKQPVSGLSHGSSGDPDEQLSWTQAVTGWLFSSSSSLSADPATGHNQKCSAGNYSQSVESSPVSGWGYLSWAQSWWPSWEANKPKSAVVVAEAVSEPVLGPRTAVVPALDDEKSVLQAAFVKECLRHYRAHTEDCLARLPLVGMSREQRPLRRAMRVLERVEESARARLLSLLSHGKSCWPKKSDTFATGEFVGDGAEAPLSDLACIGAELDTQHHQATPTPATPTTLLRRGHWVQYYMQVELLGTEKENDETVPTRDGSLVDGMKLLVLACEGYLKDQLLMEGTFFVMDDDQDMLALEKAAKDNVATVWSAVLQRSRRFLHRKTRPDDFDGGPLDVAEGVTVEVRDSSSSVNATTRAGDMTSAALSSEENADWIDYAQSWEVCSEDKGYTAYRKFYKDTGLFQYKVIGHYDDITAKDFFEAQVDQEFRKSWDVYAEDVVTVDSDAESGCKLLHWIMKYPFPMSNREYLFVQRSWVNADNNIMMIMNRSTTHPDISSARSSGCVRVKDYFSEMVIKSHSGMEDLGMDFELTYFDNPHVQLPSSCVNWVAYTAMPDFMSKIHSAALTRSKETSPSKDYF